MHRESVAHARAKHHAAMGQNLGRYRQKFPYCSHLQRRPLNATESNSMQLICHAPWTKIDTDKLMIDADIS
jgi:hypothetical protein